MHQARMPPRCTIAIVHEQGGHPQAKPRQPPTSTRAQPAASQRTHLRPCLHSGRRLRLLPQSGDRENVDIMGGVVAAEGRRRGNNSAKLGLGVAGRRVGGDLFAQALDVPDAVGHLGLAELDLQRCPAAVAKLDDDVDLQPVRVAVVAKRPASTRYRPAGRGRTATRREGRRSARRRAASPAPCRARRPGWTGRRSSVWAWCAGATWPLRGHPNRADPR